jgi:hypothetical protein
LPFQTRYASQARADQGDSLNIRSRCGNPLPAYRAGESFTQILFIDDMAPLGKAGVVTNSGLVFRIGIEAVRFTATFDGLPRLPFWTKAARFAFGGPRSSDRLVAIGLSCAVLAASAGTALSNDCKPNHPRPLIILKDMGACAFDPQTLSFAGAPADQARCLMRGMDASRNLSRPLDALPPALASRVGQDSGLPPREALSAFLSNQNLEWDFAAHLWQPLSHAGDDDPHAPMARYFVIHDTSGPNYGHRSFPADVDVNPKINSLAGFKCTDGWGKAHVVVNREGGMLLDHDLSEPWRETKFERAVNFAGGLKGLFIHVEMIQPRRSAGRWGGDAQSPDPSFTTPQYDRLALIYTIASVRAGRWLVPAFHAAIDAHIRNGHDDPLNFNVQSFANSLDGLMQQLQGPRAAQPEAVAKAHTDSAPEPNSSAVPSATPADTNSSAEAAGAKDESSTQRSAETTPLSEPIAAATPEIPIDSKIHELEIGNAGHCGALVAEGHRRTICRPHVAESRAHVRRVRVIRAADRPIPEESRGAWHNGGDAHPRHARGGPRHNRA